MAAEKQPPPSQAPPAPAEPKPGSRKKPLIIVAVLMLVEGVAIFMGTKMLTGSAPAAAEASSGAADSHGAPADGGHDDGHGGEHGDAAKNAPFASEFGEVLLSECRPTNRVSGRLITFRMRVSVLVKAPNLEKTKNLVDANKARIEDRINFVIRSADPEFLHEATLETIKRRLKSEFERLLCQEGLIEEVLIPEMLPSAPGL